MFIRTVDLGFVVWCLVYLFVGRWFVLWLVWLLIDLVVGFGLLFGSACLFVVGLLIALFFGCGVAMVVRLVLFGYTCAFRCSLCFRGCFAC